MVLPSPFDRLLEDVGKLASQDPAAAFARLDELYGKSLTAEDVLKLGAFAVHLGCAALGRFPETEAFQRRLLEHPAIANHSPTRRSLWRGLAVVLRMAGRAVDAEQAIAEGVLGDAERCRLEVLSAQTFAARARFPEATAALRLAEPLLRGLPPNEDIVAQAAQIATNLARAAESQLKPVLGLLDAATAALLASTAHQDWRRRHQALYHRGRGHLLAGDPTRALGAVQELMALEDGNDAGAMERFFTAALACRAQLVRGQRRIAAAALEAAQDFARRTGDDANVAKILADLEASAARA
jgi:hypothetical protein